MKQYPSVSNQDKSDKHFIKEEALELAELIYDIYQEELLSNDEKGGGDG